MRRELNIFMSREQNTWANDNTDIGNNPCCKIQIHGNNPKNKNCIHKEIMSRLNWGNVCYLSVPNLSARLLSKNKKIQIFTTINLPVVLYGCEILPVTMRGKNSLREFERIQFWRFNLRKRSLGRQKHRREDNINMDLQEVGLQRNGVDWSSSAYRHVTGSCERGNENMRPLGRHGNW